MLNLLKKVTPLKVRKAIYAQMANHRRAIDQKIPRYELSAKHLNHLKAVPNREILLEQLPKNAIVAEIGVDHGDFSEQILKIAQPAKLHLVDAWNGGQYPRSLMELVHKKFEEEIERKQVEINLGLSVEVGQRFPDHYFDWVYIDTAHTYEVTSKELEVYSRKVKPGGIIAGHDFIRGSWISGTRYGVIEAVYEFCDKYSWELVYISMENRGAASFAIREIV